MAEHFESVMDLFGPEIVGLVAARLNLPANVAQNGLRSSAAALLAGIAARSRQAGFMDRVWALVKDPAVHAEDGTGLISHPSALLRGDMSSPVRQLGSKVLTTVFGPHLVPISEAMGSSIGVDDVQARNLLFLVAPSVLASLATKTRVQGWNAHDLGETLRADRHEWLNYLPPNFLETMGGGVAMAPLAGNLGKKPGTEPMARNPRGGGMKWLLLLLLLALVAVAVWYLIAGKTPAPSQIDAVRPAAGFVKVVLPDGVVLDAAKSGVEDQLVNFIKDPSRPVDTTTWFNFDRLLFDTDKATLQPSSQAQLKNVSAILKAFPNVHVKIGGYTDNVGAAEHNQKLSEERAQNVARAIVADSTLR